LLVCLLIVFTGGFIICSKREHLLSVLLSMEFVSLGVFLIFLGGLYYSDLFYSLVFLTFTACEGSMALSILINMTRSYGNDLIKSLNLF